MTRRRRAARGQLGSDRRRHYEVPETGFWTTSATRNRSLRCQPLRRQPILDRITSAQEPVSRSRRHQQTQSRPRSAPETGSPTPASRQQPPTAAIHPARIRPQKPASRPHMPRQKPVPSSGVPPDPPTPGIHPDGTTNPRNRFLDRIRRPARNRFLHSRVAPAAHSRQHHRRSETGSSRPSPPANTIPTMAGARNRFLNPGVRLALPTAAIYPAALGARNRFLGRSVETGFSTAGPASAARSRPHQRRTGTGFSPPSPQPPHPDHGRRQEPVSQFRRPRQHSQRQPSTWRHGSTRCQRPVSRPSSSRRQAFPIAPIVGNRLLEGGR